MTKNPSQYRGITDAVMCVVSENWQSTSIIAAQIVFPPDAIARARKNQQEWCNRGLSESGAKTSIASKSLRSLFLRGKLERRAINANKFEYKLSSGTA